MAALLMIVVHTAWAAPPDSFAGRIRRIDIPADRPSDWPREIQQRTAVPRDEFDRLLRAADPEDHGPRRGRLSSGHYSATFVGQSLREGRATLTTRRRGPQPALLPLGDFNLALHDLAWSDRPAVWGTDEAGHSWLLVDTTTNDLTATWSAAGRSLPGEIDFDLRFPPATVSVLDLKVPKDRVVRSTPEAQRIDEGSDQNWQVWRIALGSERSCRVAVAQRGDSRSRKPAILFEHELAAVVREEDLRFQTLFQVEIFDAPASELTFTVPSSVEIYAVTYGSDLPLAWTRSDKTESTNTGAASTLTVRLPGPLLGRSRRIRIDGQAGQRQGQPAIAPQIAIKDGIFSTGRQMLTIVAPLQVRSIRTTGFRQQGALASVPEGEVVAFRQLLPEGQLILDVRRPRASLSAQVLGLLETGESSWTLTSEIIWASSSGGVFQTGCQFPPDWEITDVQLVSDRPSDQLAGWDVQPQSGGVSLMTIEFLEALEPGRPHKVKVLARRRPPTTGQSFALPVPHPNNCDDVETTLGLVVPATLTPLLSEDARLERISAPDESSTSSFRPRPLTRGQSEFWYRGDTPEAAGSLQLVSRLRPVVASSEVIVEAAPAEYRERFQIRCRAEGAPLDRLLVYLTQPGSEVRWSMSLPRPGDLTALRLPAAQHAEWNCPSTGELWELRLPPLPSGPIEIQGTRGNRWSPVARPALMLIPQATDRRGRLILRRPESLELSIDARGLEPQSPASDRGPSPEATEAASTPFVTNAWQFDAADDELTLGLRDPEPSREFPTMVSLQLRSLISANSDGFDLYRARIRLENGATQDELRIRLPSPAVLQQVTVAGEATVPNTLGEEILIPGLNAARRDTIELLYRVPARGGAVRDKRRVIVPRIAATVLGLEWEFALPPAVRLYSEPQGVRLTRPLPVSTWTERAFGPLGRPRDEAMFNPLAIDSWRGLLQPHESWASSVGELSGDLVAPVEWQVHKALSAVVPDNLWLETWHSTRTRLLSWISLGVILTIGIVLRMIGFKYRDRIAAYWLMLLVAVAFCGPSPYAEFAGGGIAGTVIALLIPRRSLLMRRRDLSPYVPGGSTQSFHFGAPAGLVLLLGCLVAGSLAQETTTPATTDSPLSALGAKRPTFTIYVPVDADGRPSQTLSLVYVPPELLTALKEAAQAKSPPPETLMAAARYRAVVGEQGNVTLRATFRVHVLDASIERRISLPIPDAVLVGADACRIDGKPHPVAAAPDGRGFVVIWSPPPRDPPDREPDSGIGPPGSAASESGRSKKPPAAPDQTPAPIAASFDIELDLKRIGNRTSQGGSFSATIPSVADTRWSIELAEPFEFFDVSGAHGAVSVTADRRGVEADFGSATRADVRWSRTPIEAKPAQVEVSLLQFLDLRPASGELRFRARCAPIEGQIDFVDFDLPAGSLLRDGDILAANLLRAEVISGPNGSLRLRVSFVEPQRQAFTIDGTLLIPFADTSADVVLPRFGPSRDAGSRTSVLQNWWCISASPEFRLEAQNLDTELLGVISAADFHQAWGDSPPAGRPQFVFQPRDGSTPAFSFAPQLARRRALSWTQTGRVGKRRLEWTLAARFEVSQAPVYQHALLVDRRLQIEAISVRENGAERLVRWSETKQNASPTRVVLFLSDKTTGMQQLTLKASMPLRYGAAIPLPFVRYEEAELIESSWELFRDPEIDVDLTLPRGVPSFEADDSPSTDEGPTLIARYQIADPDPKTSIRISSRHARCTARTAAVLVKADERGWKLTTQLWLTPQGESPRRLGVRFPASAVDPARVRIEQAEGAWHDPVDGWRRLDLALPPDPIEVSVAFDTTIDEPARGDWELPWPAPLQATSHEMCLLVAPADAWTPLVGTELKPDEAPGWAIDFLAERRPETPAAEYRLDSAPVRLRHSAAPTQMDEPAVRLLDHTLWLTPEGGRYGVSRAFLSHTREMIDFEVPEGFRPIALFLDDRPLPLPIVDNHHLRVPLLGGGRESILDLTWEQLRPQSEGYARVEREPLPWPVNVTVSRSLVMVVPHRDGWVIGRAGLQRLDWMDAALDRLHMLLDRQASLDGDPRAAAANRELIDNLQTRVAARLPARTVSPSAALTARLARWNEIVEAINRLEPTSNTAATGLAPRSLSHLEDQFVDHPHVLRSAATSVDRNVGFWLIDRRWLGTIIAALLSLLTIPTLRRLIRLDWGEWLSARVTVSWLLLGLIWWLYLTPGVLGMVMISIAAIRTTFHHNTRRESSSSAS